MLIAVVALVATTAALVIRVVYARRITPSSARQREAARMEVLRCGGEYHERQKVGPTTLEIEWSIKIPEPGGQKKEDAPE